MTTSTVAPKLIHLMLVSDQTIPNLIPALMERPDRVYLVATDAMQRKGMPRRLENILDKHGIRTETVIGAPDAGLATILEFAGQVITRIQQSDPTAQIVHKSLKDLVAAAKKSPNTIRTATTGILSDDHLAILMVEEASPGAIFRIVHLEGGAAQMTGILGGHIDVAFDNVGSVFRRIRTGEVRALAVMDTQRSRFLPDVPTTPELGFPNVISNSTRGIAAPKGVPAPVIKRLQEVFKKAIEDPEHVKKMDEVGLALRVMVGEEYAKYYRDLHAKATKYTEWARSRPHK